VVSLSCGFSKSNFETTDYVQNTWCKALANKRPTKHPKWGAHELERRKKVVDQETLSNSTVDLDTVVKSAATNAEGTPIFPSEGGQDRWLWLNHFRKMSRPIVYADFGSNHAIFTSNTFFLDQCLGASGVCVEANPRLAPDYKWRNCAFHSTCLSDTASEVEFAFQPGISTRSGILKYNKNYKNGSKRTKTVVKMTCTTGAQIFQASKLNHIDLLDLDAEGHELGILQGIDWNQVTIDIILVEANDKNVFDFLRGKGYSLYLKSRLHYDYVYVRSGFKLNGV
jgi:FkbM family methyltransferase